MMNVLALNLAYDVPVKLYSFHVLFMIAALIAPELRRLTDLLIRNRPVVPASDASLFSTKKYNLLFMAAQLAFCAYIGLNALFQAHKVAGALPRPPHYGVWLVEEFTADHQTLIAPVEDSVRWRRVVFDEAGTLAIQPLDGHLRRFYIESEIDGVIKLTGEGDDSESGRLAIDQISSNQMKIAGDIDGNPVQARLRRIDARFLLTSRGFHWINEYPLKR